MKNEISLALILLATACLGSPALWAWSFTGSNQSKTSRFLSRCISVSLNRRASQHQGKRFSRFLHHAMLADPSPYGAIITRS
jgi:hypothetical protein